ncbi:NUDIX hydrolase [Tunicatimonas pelagia]|uniref:NUDIX hydrolase n=1 Tax=Tunicatimonas pelagia TaxID=931531 RepID=UPI0026663EAC|nr:NUDIX domain-containing protein [Tunicatimonas pelagia]WKN46085.1 NUDIX domain-containing protein [Tunicatimonas pelagia]
MMYFKIAIDCVIIGYDSQLNELKILLTKRVNMPQKGEWALPGGFIKKTEGFEETASSILQRETGMANVYLRQLKAYSLTDITQDNRIASVAYYSFIKFEELTESGQQQTSRWFPFKEVPPLPFDHSEKVAFASEKIKELVKLEPIAYHLLPTKFPLNQLQRFYEALYNIKIDNRNFRKKILKLPYIERLDELEKNVSHRPGHLYRFNPEKYQESSSIY